MSQPNLANLPPELLAKMERWEANKPANKQLTYLSDIADIVQEMLSVMDDSKKSSESQFKQLGAVLTDAREQLVALNQKEAPEAPDASTPVVKAIDKLVAELGKKDFKPTINVEAAKVDVPTPIANVTVDAPKVDTKGIEKAIDGLKTTIIDSVASIPQVELPEYPDRWDEVIDWLKSIDTASRLKPEPGTIKVTNPDGSAIGSLSGSTAYENRNDTTTDTNLVYLGKALPGSGITDAAWQIKRYNKSAGHMSFADDATTYTKVWDNRTSYTY